MKTILFALLASSLSLAKEFPAQARLFAGGTAGNLDGLNATLSSDGLKKIKTVAEYGVEIGYPVLQFLEFGIRYMKHSGSADENPTNLNTNYFAEIDQDTAMLTARIPLLKSNIVRLDVFGGAGGSNTKFQIKTATQDGKLEKAASEGWFATPYSAVGASLGVGYNGFYFYLEGGAESNKVKGMTSTGTVNSNIQRFDLSGSYFAIGLMFNGIKASTK